MNPFTHALLCCALLFLTLKELTEACSCLPSHPQQQFCDADIVFRAKVTGEKGRPTDPMQSSTVQYLIKVLKVFKGFEKGNIHSVYTASQSATCGITLELKKEYLIAGHFGNGNVHISLCGLVTPWDRLSQFQIKMLTQTDVGYLQGCLCKIKNCARESCNIHERNVCHWPDSKNLIWDTEHACIKKRDGSCSWHPALPDKSEFNTHP